MSKTAALIVSTSRFWFNYRHSANALSIYYILKRLGLSDDRIILMLSDDISCNSRNKEPGCIFNHYDRLIDLNYGPEVDYGGDQVTLDSLLSVLQDNFNINTPSSKRLLSDDTTDVLIYLAGHGGDGFLKFQDSHEITSKELADAISYMYLNKRFRSALLIIDTCQAQSMVQYINVPQLISITSSRVGESSYSHHVDGVLGVPIIDRFTNHIHSFLSKYFIDQTFNPTIGDFVKSWEGTDFHSTPTVSFTDEKIDIDKIPMSLYFSPKAFIAKSVQFTEFRNFPEQLYIEPFSVGNAPSVALEGVIDREYFSFILQEEANYFMPQAISGLLALIIACCLYWRLSLFTIDIKIKVD